MSDGIMVATLEAKQHQGQGCEFRMSWRKGASSICQLLRPVLVLLGLPKFVLPPATGRQKVSRGRVNLPGNFEISSLPVMSRNRSLVEDPSFASALAAQASRGKSRRIDVPPQYSRWVFHNDSLHYWVIRCFSSFSSSLNWLVYCIDFILM